MADYNPPHTRLLRRWGDLWAEKIAKYGCRFFAAAPCPGNGGDRQTVHDTRASFSAVFAPGWRTFAFKEEHHRDEFVRDVPRSLKVENPYG